MGMFCYQCEQTAKGTGCDISGVCGKDPVCSNLQDVIVHLVKGVAMYADKAAKLGVSDKELNLYVIEALFTTVTNVDFDPAKLIEWVTKGVEIRTKAKSLYKQACAERGLTPEKLTGAVVFTPAEGIAALVVQAETIGINQHKADYGDDIAGLHDLVLFGIKGAAAYMDHAHILGKESAEISAKFNEIMAYLGEGKFDVDGLVAHAMAVGQLNFEVMELLDAANTETYGHPVPTAVRIEPVKGKAILVSGHDLKDLEELLKQTEGKGINIYTHGEMLPCHGYPKLKAYKHLVGNYGGAWQDQRKEFDEFPGAILMTTNCIQKPKDSYIGRIFTTGLVAWPGAAHVEREDFSPVIEAALAAPGFTEDGSDKTILVGFGRNAVLGVADKVIDAVKSGAIKHFYLIGGCDGAKPGRNWYTDFATSLPKDTVILTLACGKYRFNKIDFGDIGGIPRLLDIGQCNDAYSAIKIALALSDAFGVGVNELPLSLVLSWYEQKAVAILLTLLSLGIKNIKIGPSLPAFVTPPVLKVIVDNFNLQPIA